MVAVHRDVLVDVFGIDHTAVTQHDAGLLFVEIGFGKCFDRLAGSLLFVEQALDESAFDEVFRNDLGNVLHLHAAVERAFRIDDDDGTDGTKTKTTGLNRLHVGGEVCLSKLFVKCLQNVRAVVGVTTCTTANQNVTSVHIFLLSYLTIYSVTGSPPKMCFSTMTFTFAALRPA